MKQRYWIPFLLALFSGSSMAIDVSSWTGVGTYGSAPADGVVPLAPGSTGNYAYVSTSGSTTIGLGLAGISASATNGSTMTSPLFAAKAGDPLEFYFDFVTTDGGTYSDYAWARLLDEDNNLVSLLFTARTAPTGNTVPGHGMPPLNATLTPASTPIIPGGPIWSTLGSSSNSCFSSGCGYTGWIKASYSIPATGNYRLELGVVNWSDEAYASGMAFDGLMVAGRLPPAPLPAPPQSVNPVPTLGETGMVLLLLALGGLGGWQSRRRQG